MTNAGLKALKEKYGERIFSISFDNNIVETYGYSNDPHTITGDVSFIDSGTQTGIKDDLIITGHQMIFGNKLLHYQYIHASETVQWVGIMSAESNDYRPDPLTIKGW